jgi:hypothetical protein
MSNVCRAPLQRPTSQTPSCPPPSLATAVSRRSTPSPRSYNHPTGRSEIGMSAAFDRCRCH